MSECSNCSGGLHHICTGNCNCGCDLSHALPNYIGGLKKAQDKLKKIREIVDFDPFKRDLDPSDMYHIMAEKFEEIRGVIDE